MRTAVTMSARSLRVYFGPIAIPGALGQSTVATLLGIGVSQLWGWSISEGLILGHFATKLGVPLDELTGRLQKTQLGVGGVALGYAIAKAAKVAPDEIFANKADNKTWPELMRDRQVTVNQLQDFFKD